MSCAPNIPNLIPSLGATVQGQVKKIDKLSSILDPNQSFYRIETMGGGNCFFHSILTLLSPSYITSRDPNFRTRMALQLRVEVAQFVSQESFIFNNRLYLRELFPRLDEYPYIHWDETNLADDYFQQLLGATHLYLENELTWDNYRNYLNHLYGGIDYSSKQIVNLFNSQVEVGQEVFDLVAKYLNIDIYVVTLYVSGEIKDYYSTSHRESGVPAIIIALVQGHYEAIFSISEQNGKMTTFYPAGSLISTNLRDFFRVERPPVTSKHPEDLDWSDLTRLIEEKQSFPLTPYNFVSNVTRTALIFISTSCSDPRYYYLYVRHYLLNILIPSYAQQYYLTDEEKQGLYNTLKTTLKQITSIDD